MDMGIVDRKLLEIARLARTLMAVHFPPQCDLQDLERLEVLVHRLRLVTDEQQDRYPNLWQKPRMPQGLSWLDRRLDFIFVDVKNSFLGETFICGYAYWFANLFDADYSRGTLISVEAVCSSLVWGVKNMFSDNLEERNAWYQKKRDSAEQKRNSSYLRVTYAGIFRKKYSIGFWQEGVLGGGSI